MFDWITGLVERTGYVGIALLMLAENVFPPIPSELIMPLAGFAAAQGELGMAGVVAAGTAGALAGALLWYGLGRWVGLERLKRWAAEHGRWLTVSPDDLDRAAAWFGRHGGAAVLVGRLVPAVRTLISVPAGHKHGNGPMLHLSGAAVKPDRESMADSWILTRTSSPAREWRPSRPARCPANPPPHRSRSKAPLSPADRVPPAGEAVFR
jgi:membrane protein YqaA with SNARE-associated domain